LQPVDRDLLDRHGARRHELQRWQSLHDGRFVRGRYVRWDRSDLHGERCLSYGGQLRPHERRVLQSDRPRRDRVQWQRPLPDLRVPRRHLRRSADHVPSPRRVPHSGHVRPDDGAVLESRDTGLRFLADDRGQSI
jgi:hypothetical protein